jgi:hypothetical protein
MPSLTCDIQFPMLQLLPFTSINWTRLQPPAFITWEPWTRKTIIVPIFKSIRQQKQKRIKFLIYLHHMSTFSPPICLAESQDICFFTFFFYHASWRCLGNFIFFFSPKHYTACLYSSPKISCPTFYFLIHPFFFIFFAHARISSFSFSFPHPSQNIKQRCHFQSFRGPPSSAFGCSAVGYNMVERERFQGLRGRHWAL